MKAITALFFLFCFLVPSALAQLQFGFYGRSCPRAETIVANVVANRFRSDRTIPAALLRMQFHDCFVRGCDASLLIDPRPGRPSEKSTGPNASVRGFEIIDEAKRQLEIACPRRVSCADIVTLATRDAVALAGGPRFSVPTGRRDGLRSNPNDVNLPGPTIPVAAAIQTFAAQGMSVNDMVTLIGGGHSVGVAHCSLFQDRLADPAMDRTLNARLRNTCRSPNDPSVFLDQKTPFTVDNAIYGEIQRQRGILRIDQNMGLDGSTRGIVSGFASSNTLFRQRFAQAMVKMGRIRVLTGTAGEIRRNCRVFNNGR
ncbi:Peroxidase 44 [Cardamine amara subsp. amara]|uniref:Peroxidase n=1 Tax=Cardamine amara subsp. amara TaxID=228776 RepID=A0ABD1AN32_CARAN